MTKMTKAQRSEKLAEVRAILETHSDTEIAEMANEALAMIGKALAMVEQEPGCTIGELVIDQVACSQGKVLDMPLRGGKLKDFLPPSYAQRGISRSMQCGAYFAEFESPLLGFRDVPLEAKISIIKRVYSDRKADVEKSPNDDAKRVKLLVAEAQHDLLTNPFRNSRFPATRVGQLALLMGFFDMASQRPKRLRWMTRRSVRSRKEVETARPAP